jgi:multidrug resistance efflux pump
VWIWISRVFRSILGLAAVLVAVSLFMYLAKSRTAPSQNDDTRALPIVRAVRLQPQPIAMQWTGYGTARALNASDVAAEVAGRVVERPEGLEAGMPVSEGDLLVTLDPRDYESRALAARKQAESLDAQLSALEIEEARLSEQADLLNEELAVAQRELDRAKETLDAGAGNASAVDARLQSLKALSRSRATILSQLEVIPSRRAQIQASLEAAQADQRLAEDNLGRTQIRAPFAGVLQSIGVEVGEWARAGDTIARVVDLSVIEVPLRLPQSSVGRVAVGDDVKLTAEGPSLLAWAGSVGRIAPESDASTRSATVFVEVRQRPEADSRTLLRPGQFVMGSVVSRERTDSLVFPRRSVDAGRVLVARPWREGDPEPPEGARTPMVVREAEIVTGTFIEDRFESIDPAETQWVVARSVGGRRGVEAGSIVITSNLEMLRPGDLVDIRLENEDDPAVTPAANPNSGIAAKPNGNPQSEDTP